MDGKVKLFPIPNALQYMFIIPEMSEEVFSILEEKITKGKRITGCKGMELWQIFVISELRAGLDTII